ncbi:hypothetical protein DdX_14599 [Ditylenchus destructor]|uniref:Uncharacterized protein n=1 Tax=Ditylenchus destructor TaxID=166010 RepID=A0AAD4MU44_9BILA|nr:hypothetical protein DdX_14599 [Ditylenchus destructor]
MTLEDYSVLLEDSAISHSNAHHAPNHRPACTHSSRNISQHTRRLALITYPGQCIEKRIKGEVKEKRGSLGRPRGRLSDLSGQPSLGLVRGEDHAARAPSAQLKPAQDQDFISINFGNRVRRPTLLTFFTHDSRTVTSRHYFLDPYSQSDGCSADHQPFELGLSFIDPFVLHVVEPV